MERLAKVDHVLLDKTGTLTSGRPTIGAITVAKGRRRDTAIRLAGGLEVASSHPYALAVGDLLEEENPAITDVLDEEGLYSELNIYQNEKLIE